MKDKREESVMKISLYMAMLVSIGIMAVFLALIVKLIQWIL